MALASRTFCKNFPLSRIGCKSSFLPTRRGPRYIYTSSLLLKEDGKDRIVPNPFFDKYKDKLGRHIVQSDASKEDKSQSQTGDASGESGAKGTSGQPTHSFTQAPSLKDVMHLDKLYDKTAEEIAELWKHFHSDKDKISAVIPSSVYSGMYSLSQHCPLFVYPLPRSQGYEILFSQFSGHRCYITSLLLYKTHQENAPSCLTLTHYTDLVDSRGIVLMSGEVDVKMISVVDAQYLANQVQLYYATAGRDPGTEGGSGRRELLRAFNHSPESFDYTKLFEQLHTGIQSQATNTK